MSDFLGFLSENAVFILAAMVAASTFGAAVARLTPSDKDDAFFAKASAFLLKLGSFGVFKAKP